MFNLLPIEQKREIKREYILRLLIVAGVSVFISAIIAAFLIVPNYLVASAQYESVLAEKLGLENLPEFKEADELRNVIRESRDKLSIFAAFSREVPVSKILDKVLAARSESSGIKITVIRLARKAENVFVVTLSGKADNRDALLSFKKRLDSDGTFEKVLLPVSNFASAEDIEFIISAEAAFKI